MRIGRRAFQGRDDADNPAVYFAALYAAFNARAMDEVLAKLHAEVDWPNAWEGGYLHGRSEVRSYWERQWAAIDAQVQPLNVRVETDGTVVVLVQQVVHDLKGNALSYATLEHVYRLRDGLIDRMEVRSADPA